MKIIDGVIGGDKGETTKNITLSKGFKIAPKGNKATTPSPSPRGTTALQNSELAQASYTIIHFLFSQLDGISALSLQIKYNTALGNNDADAMSVVYYACINELKANFLSKNPTYAQRNNFELLFGAATKPESNGGAVACVGALISFVKNPH